MGPIALRGEIARISLDLSRVRKCTAIMLELNVNYFLDTRVPSSRGEMEADWHHACVCFVDAMMTREIGAEELVPAELQLLDDVWIDDLKRHLAFCYWLDSHSDDSSAAFRELQYYRACDALDERLADPRNKATPDARQVLLSYLTETYAQSGRDHDAAVARLIARKAKRLPSDAKDLAAEFVHTFYPNIIKAISGQDHGTNQSDATLEVLRALRLGGGKHPIRPEIVSGMETVLAVGLLDAAEVTRAWSTDPSTRSPF